MKLLLALALSLPLSAAPALKPDIRYQRVRGSLPERQRLDVHYDDAKTTVRQPVVLWIHGGAWRFGSKEHATSRKAAALHKASIILVAVNYRFHPQVSYKEQAADIAAAIKWTHDHIAAYGGDPNRLAIMGHSAGAHLAALVATDHSYLKAAKVDPGIIKAVIPLDGAGYDIPHHLKTAGPRAAKIYKTVFTDNPPTQRDASPISHLRKGTKYPPFLIIPCASRTDSTDQSQRLAKALKATGSSATVSPAKGKTHMTLNKEWGSPGDLPTKDCLEFLLSKLAASDNKRR